MRQRWSAALAIAGLFSFLVLCSCASAPAKKSAEISAAAAPLSATISWQITDYRGKAESAEIPLWVMLYLEGGNSAVEALDEYQDRYIFIGRNSGTNFNALEQWRAGFSPELDFARLGAIRMEERFLSSASKNPDDEYGSYFETMIRAASDASWAGVIKEEDFWIKRHFPEADESGNSSEARETWDFFILVTLEKTSFISQCMNLLKAIKPSLPLSRDQSAAVNRILDRFPEGF